MKPVARKSRQRWLKRMRRELAASGAVPQLAWRLAREDGHENPSSWETRLRSILLGSLPPDPETIFRIETLLARPSPGPPPQFPGALPLPFDPL